MYDNIINNKKGFNWYDFQDEDYTLRPPLTKTSWDLKSVFLVADFDKFTEEELLKLDEFGKEFTAKYDTLFKIRIGANYIHVGRNEYGYCVKRESWNMAKYPETFEGLCEWLDKLLDK